MPLLRHTQRCYARRHADIAAPCWLIFAAAAACYRAPAARGVDSAATADAMLLLALAIHTVATSYILMLRLMLVATPLLYADVDTNGARGADTLLPMLLMRYSALRFRADTLPPPSLTLYART